MPDSVVSYTVGTGTALVSSHTVVLFGPEVAGDVAIGLWASVREAASLQEVVDSVMAIGLSNLPSVGIVHRDAQGVRLLLRGAVRATVQSAGGADDSLSAGQTSTWSEQLVEGPTRIFLPDAADGDTLPVLGGMVAAGSISISWAESDASTVTGTGMGPGGSTAESGQGVRLPTEPLPTVAPAEPAPAASDPNSTLMASDLPGITEGADSGSIGDGPRPADGGGSHPGPEVIPTAAASPDSGDDDFDDLFGATRLPLPVEHAAVRRVDSDDSGDGSPATERQPTPPPDASPAPRPPAPPQPGPEARPEVTPGFAPPRPRGPLPAAVPPPASGSSRLIDGVPGMGAVTPGPPGPGPTGPGSADPTEAPRNGASGSPVPQGPETRRQDVVADGRSGEPAEDPGNLTMTRSQLGKLKGPERPVATLTGASVHGVRCPSGHPNPPAATMCRICGIGLGDADPVSMPRPLLGRLLFSNGTEVQLDRPAIVGRLPKAERVSARELPQLVTVPSPDKDISRNHLEVRIDGWHVLVVDLGSTNGTVVTMPGQPPERLRAGEEQPIVPGTVVTIADEITFVYEVSG